MNEILDLVNEKDEVVGKMDRDEVYAKKLNNFRVVNAFVVNDERKIWIPRRTSHKRLFPNALDVSVGGHVETGESYDETLVRETKEEINIDLDKVKWRLLGKLTPHEDDVSAFMWVYEINFNNNPPYNEHDFSEFFWLSPKEVIEKIENGDKSKGDLPKLIKHFYLS